MQSINQRLATYEQERRDLDATLRDHYGLQHKPWPWEQPLPQMRLAADALVALAASIKTAVRQRRSLAPLQVEHADKCVEVRVNTHEEAEQLLQLLPQDMRSLVAIHASEDSHVDSEQYARV